VGGGCKKSRQTAYSYRFGKFQMNFYAGIQIKWTPEVVDGRVLLTPISAVRSHCLDACCGLKNLVVYKRNGYNRSATAGMID